MITMIIRTKITTAATKINNKDKIEISRDRNGGYVVISILNHLITHLCELENTIMNFKRFVPMLNDIKLSACLFFLT